MIHNFVFIIAAYLKFLIQKDLDVTLKINLKNMLNTTINELLYLLIYKTTTKSTINKIIRILERNYLFWNHIHFINFIKMKH